jgi:hypothetical protein
MGHGHDGACGWAVCPKVTVYGDEVSHFVRGTGLDFGEHQAIGWRGRDGRIEAGAVFHNWNPKRSNIEISVAGSGAWINRRRVADMFDYPFRFCRLVWGRTESPTLRRAWRHLGGTEYDIPGLFSVVTLTAGQWTAWKDKQHGR